MNKLLRKIKYVLLPMLTIVLLCTGEAKAKDYSCSIQIPVTTEVSNNAPAGTDFHIVMEPIGEDVPMPEVSDIVLTDNANYSFGPITYVTPEDYQYRIYQEKGNAKNFTYDDTVYTVTVRVVNAEDGGLKAVIWAIKDGEENKVDEITFINKYNPPTPEVSTGDTANINEIMSIMGISLLCIVFIYTKKQSFMA